MSGPLLAGSVFAAVDPCSQTNQLSGGTTINNQNKTGNTSTGYQYEIWRDGNGGSLTLYPKDACFRAEWNNAGDFLGRVGKTFNKPAWNNIGGDLVANYAYKKSGDDGGTYSYIGIYGWMDNPQIEYFIVDDWLHDRGNPGGSYMGSKKGTITVDGETIEPLTIPADVWIVFKPGEWPEMELTIVEKPSAITGLSYNGSEQVGVIEGVGYTLAGHKATAAGAYTATATLREGYKWADGSVGEITISWSIDMGVAQIPSVVTGLTYNGSEQTGVMEGEGYTLVGHTASQIGTHTATATLKENYKWSDGSMEEKVIPWVIAAGAVEVPVAVEGLKYNGKEQVGVLEGEGYTLTNHKATDVGSYTATATLLEGYVWADGTSGDKEISWTIALGIVQVPVAVPNLHYNGKEQTGVLEGTGYTLTNNKATGIGTYTATATLVDVAKYIWSDGTMRRKRLNG